MKRHESIVALSRDHHDGLLFCWKIRQGIKKQVPAERIKAYVKYFWDDHLQQHFEEEETWLFPALQDPLIERAISEHKHIGELVKIIVTTEPIQTDQLNTLARLLDDHIRFEERVLFPHLEKELSGEKLNALGKQLQQLHRTPARDTYPDAFWV